jgi:TPR repeat protein
MLGPDVALSEFPPLRSAASLAKLDVDAGHPRRAQGRVGSPHGRPSAAAAAIYWFSRAAEQGEAKVQRKLGWMSEAGLGNPQGSFGVLDYPEFC